uniref:Plant heme peroxidase family profile domain-containing protein n=1 Tax=Aegilops tauschii subsp. strangulata TaxID=200361 RepID=A0A453L198_AEGTS
RADAAVRDLKVGYYAQTCPRAEEIVRRVMARALAREARSVASVMRLQFHDCFVNGCDGSVLMDATPTMAGEKEALSNINSLRSFEVVDEVKSALEEQCPGIVSCADIIIMAARDAVVLVRTPPSSPAPGCSRNPCRAVPRSRGADSPLLFVVHETRRGRGRCGVPLFHSIAGVSCAINCIPGRPAGGFGSRIQTPEARSFKMEKG